MCGETTIKKELAERLKAQLAPGWMIDASCYINDETAWFRAANPKTEIINVNGEKAIVSAEATFVVSSKEIRVSYIMPAGINPFRKNTLFDLLK